MSFLQAARPCRANRAWRFSFQGFQSRNFSRTHSVAPITAEEVQGAHKYCVALLSYATPVSLQLLWPIEALAIQQNWSTDQKLFFQLENMTDLPTH